MASPIPLRPDYDGPALVALARRSRQADQTRRLLALASIYDGGGRSAAAKLGGVGLQIVRDWVLAFNALGAEFGVSLDVSTMSREMKALGFAKLSARPRHYAQDVQALEEFKKTSPPNWQRSGPDCRREPT